MLGLDMLDVAIGVVFVYLLLSLIASAAAEVWEAIWKMRAVYLEKGMKELLGDGNLVKKLYNHPLINGLYEGGYTGDKGDKSKLPSYIPARTFALAIMDLLLSSSGTTPTEGTPVPTEHTTVATGDAAKGNATANDEPFSDQAKRAVDLLTKAAGNDAEQARKNIEDWYNSAMDRVSGWYKRRTQMFLFGLGLLVAIVLNVDSIRVVRALSTDKPKRDAIVGIATKYVKEHPAPPASTTTNAPSEAPVSTTNPAGSNAIDKNKQGSAAAPPTVSGTAGKQSDASNIDDPATADAKAQTKAALDQLDSLGLPIGWKNYGCPLCEAPCVDKVNPSLNFWEAIPTKIGSPHWLRCWLLILAGWLITALAVSLGAPFWFDMLNKIIVVRSTVKPQEKSGTEAPKDPQTKKA